ncbi:aldolase catalytic domain-containing protein [Mucilaginibacter terrae]|uniref:4-hydroxy 2-oxovalerate aldolase n=1 Tax=Mucilaginibacter terrae TaxID=1955052 RepID=A0ABU3GVD7_9SPHI|nr:aldolase catalytic domain-containing protein [Mucilaginibacter terrae]MDT3403630.1 4-hydroxy 2-oxovalerate aldolase [Mucilaginibacter terrae]
MKILDCTLRDGGYYTQWDFDKKLTERYFTAMEQLPIDVVEIGYRSHASNTYFGKYYYSPVSLLQKARQLMPTKKLALMLNLKDCPANDSLIPLLEKCRGYADLFRIAADPAKINEAIALAKFIKSLGFGVALNLMYLSELKNSVTIVERLGELDGVADCISLVDSYGGVYPHEVAELIKYCKNFTNVPLGFHGHNNIELAFANSLAAIEAGCEFVDGTITGMGRGAGNLKTELLLTHLSAKAGYNVNYDVLSNIVHDFEHLKAAYQWGTNLPYMVSGINSLPQQNVMDWISKRYYSVQSIVRALHNKKLGTDDNIKLPGFNPAKNHHKAFIIGGGSSVITHLDAILAFIKAEPDACLIHASAKNAALFASVNNAQFYCLVGNEGQRLEDVFNNIGAWTGDCVLPVYPRKMGTYIPQAAYPRVYELDSNNFDPLYADAHTSLAIQTAIKLGVTEVYVVGYDGYNSQNLTEKEQDLINENEYLFDRATQHFNTFKAITATRYKIADQASVYQFIA